MAPRLYGMLGDSPSLGDPPRSRWAPGERKPVPRPKQSCKVKGLAAKRKVWLGDQQKTKGGLLESDLRHNQFGRVVSAKLSSQKTASYQGSKLQKWNQAVQKAREASGKKHFVRMGKGEEGRLLQKMARVFYEQLLQDEVDACALAIPLTAP